MLQIDIKKPEIEHPRDRMRILFINTQEQALIARLGLPPYRKWIADVTQLPEEQIAVINVADGEELPTTIEAYGVIGGGSGHSSFEEHDWIRKTKEFLREVQRKGIPELHICWSHQAKAESEGGMVLTGKKGRRFGIERLQLTPAGRQDPLFRDLPQEFDIFTTHTDVVEKIPVSLSQQVIELAKSKYYDYEALAYGSTVRTLQAHPEITADILTPFAHARRKQLIEENLIGASSQEYETYLDILRKNNEQIKKNSRKLVNNWLYYFVAPRMHL